MGAALHLAHAHQPQPAAGPKRKGGGGSDDGYDRIVARVYRDPRQTPESRELILLLAWLLRRDPNRHTDVGAPKSVWERATEVLGVDFTRRQPPRLAYLIATDAPRYETDYQAPEHERRCGAPMIRRVGECGQPGVDGWAEVDPETGWRTLRWSCGRHRAWGVEQQRVERQKPRVEPIPNRGGLLPCYFAWPDEKWINTYRWALKWRHERSWEPPTYGLRADGWPTPGVEMAELVPGEQPQLRLAAADGELLATQ